jgi:hypothetical protein
MIANQNPACPNCGKKVFWGNRDSHPCFKKHLKGIDRKLSSLVAAERWRGRRPERHCRAEEASI